ncbi:hypothetical protein PoB_004036100 [Plakobranchus ocellatus]|uniref:Sm domain-containing protein n=1 Tax=Plakobranchus ocellatus TaxID=259542 RepID=A0AAV4ART9_9GAST|nr:hypothetical protein PoB_004036100 [Plakobranchus ocellatus]
MVCLLKAIERKRITIEIRNGVKIQGILVAAEPTMNLNMADVTLTPIKGIPVQYSKFFVKGRQIRYVVVPDEVDMLKAMNWQLNKAEYFKHKERSRQQKIFDKKQMMRQKRAEKLEKKEQSEKQ